MAPTRRTTVLVDSRFRDTSLYPGAHSFTLRLGETLTNVRSVSLDYARYDLVGGQPYVNLHVEEFGEAADTVVAIDQPRASFAVLPMVAPVNEYTSGRFTTACEFRSPIASLDRLTLRVTRPNGEPESAMLDFLLRMTVTCSEAQARWERVPLRWELPGR